MRKIYEVEMSSTTYRTFEIVADSPEDAQNIAFAQLDEDYMISTCLLYTSPSPRDRTRSRMPSSA